MTPHSALNDLLAQVKQEFQKLRDENERLSLENERLSAHVRELLDVIETDLHEEYAGKDG